MPHYDVIVIGAGPAGLSFGASIHKKKVLLAEKKKVPGYPVKSSAVTFSSTISRFRLADAVCHGSNRIRIFLDSGWEKEFTYQDPVLYTLDFVKMCRILRERAEKNCLVQTGIPVEKVLVEEGEVKGIFIRGEFHTADLYVDASGEARVLLKHLAPRYYRKQWLVCGIEYEMERLVFDSGRFDFFFGNRIIPEGYAWVFPTGNRSARIGLGKLIPGRGGRKPAHLKERLSAFLASDICPVAFPEGEQIREVHKGIMTYYKPLSTLYFKNTFIIGDAASHSSCLLGEGIRFCLISGQQLAEMLNVQSPARTARQFERAMKDMTRYFAQFVWFLRGFVHGPNRMIHALVKALSHGNAARLERLMKSCFRPADFIRLPLQVMKNLMVFWR